MKKASMSQIVIAGRQCGKSWSTGVILGMEHGFTYAADIYTVQEWLAREITPEEMERFPNAKKAAEIKSTKLYKALK